jgi:hypothetical protein
MTFHSVRKTKTSSRTKSVKPGPRPGEGLRRHHERPALDLLNDKIRATLGETFKLSSFPFVVLLALSAASLLSRIWLIRH